MKIRTLATLTACCVTLVLPLRAADLPQLITDAAKYESDKSPEPLRQIEQLIRDWSSQPILRSELETALVKLLAPTATFEARRFACQQLMIIGTDASLPALAELLKNEETVGIACLALSSQRSPKAAEVLRNALAGASGKARLQLISALGNHQDSQSVPTLAGLARDPDAAVASTAILALGKIGSTAAHDAVAALRKENKPAVAWAVAEATLRVVEQLTAKRDRKAAAALAQELLATAQAANIRRGAFGALLRLDQDGGEGRIVETLHGQDALLKPVAITAVGTLKSGGASKKFARELPKLSPQEQAWMIDALATRGDAAARSAIRDAIASPAAPVRLAAFSAIGRLNDTAAAPLLCATLAKTPDREERQEIASALGQLRGSATDKSLLTELKRAQGDLRRELIGIVAKRGNRVAVPALLDETGSSDAATATAAFQALARLAEAADFQPLLAKLTGLKVPDARDAAESAVASAMAKISDPARRSEVLGGALAKATDVEVRCSLLRLMPNCGCGDALAVLTVALKDSDTRVRETAVRALADWPDTLVWDTLLGVWRQPEKEAYGTLAMRGLVRLADGGNAKVDAALIDRYRQLFDGARRDDERKLVLGALAGAASPEALQLALAQLPNKAVRAETAAAVQKIAAAIRAKHPQVAQDALRQLKTAKP